MCFKHFLSQLQFSIFLFSLLFVVTSTGYLEIDTTFMFFLACLFKSSRVSCELEENKFLRRGKEPIEWYLTTSYWSNSCCRGFRLFLLFDLWGWLSVIYEIIVAPTYTKSEETWTVFVYVTSFWNIGYGCFVVKMVFRLYFV